MVAPAKVAIHHLILVKVRLQLKAKVILEVVDLNPCLATMETE
jgi:hypothetical protein